MRFNLLCEKLTAGEAIPEINEYVRYMLDTRTGKLWLSETQYIGLKEGKIAALEGVLEEDKTDRLVPEWDLSKTKDIKRLKIQMGLSCNYSCSYCSQKYVERPVQGTPDKVDELIDELMLAFDFPKYGNGLRIEFWGGEPLVYWKTMKPLAEKLRQVFPMAVLSVITNGSLLTREIVDWMVAYGFSMSISHDGPGQSVRGPDPLETNEDGIRYAVEKLHRKGRGAFGSMLNRHNMSRVAIQKWFDDKFGPGIGIGEGGMVEAYDEDGYNDSLQTKAEHFEFRRIALQDILGQYKLNFSSVNQRIDSFVSMLVENKPLGGGMKCGMEDPTSVAVDMSGNVITCQNTSAVAVADNGQPHLAGHISKLDEVKLKAPTHWADRPHCQDCPVVPVCRGSCMYIYGDNWWKTCDNQFSDNIVMLAMAVLQLTGYLPVFIDNEHLPDHRKDIWGRILEHKEKQVAFPLRVVKE
jgi:uncharacterized protein